MMRPRARNESGSKRAGGIHGCSRDRTANQCIQGNRATDGKGCERSESAAPARGVQDDRDKKESQNQLETECGLPRVAWNGGAQHGIGWEVPPLGRAGPDGSGAFRAEVAWQHGNSK